MDYRDKHKLYQISIFEEEKFKRKVAGLGVDDLKELKSYFDEAMPIAKRIKNVDLKIRLTNYKYLTAYMADDQTIKRMKLEEQKNQLHSPDCEQTYGIQSWDCTLAIVGETLNLL